jgi:hypothetical protein
VTTVEISGNDLVVRFNGLNQLWALKRGFTIPLAHVQQAGLASPGITPNGLRAPGTFIPGGRLIAGTWRSGNAKEFWNVRDRTRAVVTALNGEPYTRLVLQVPDPGTTVAAIESARTRPASAGVPH